MAEVCPKCGLPKAICVCKTIEQEQQRVRIRLETRRWGRATTVVEGLNGSKKELSDMASRLKAICACGGGAKDGVILLQGDHRQKVKEILCNLGFQPENVEVI